MRASPLTQKPADPYDNPHSTDSEREEAQQRKEDEQDSNQSAHRFLAAQRLSPPDAGSAQRWRRSGWGEGLDSIDMGTTGNFIRGRTILRDECAIWGIRLSAVKK